MWNVVRRWTAVTLFFRTFLLVRVCLLFRNFLSGSWSPIAVLRDLSLCVKRVRICIVRTCGGSSAACVSKCACRSVYCFTPLHRVFSRLPKVIGAFNNTCHSQPTDFLSQCECARRKGVSVLHSCLQPPNPTSSSTCCRRIEAEWLKAVLCAVSGDCDLTVNRILKCYETVCGQSNSVVQWEAAGSLCLVLQCRLWVHGAENKVTFLAGAIGFNL